jgi:hypothetical protein
LQGDFCERLVFSITSGVRLAKKHFFLKRGFWDVWRAGVRAVPGLMVVRFIFGYSMHASGARFEADVAGFPCKRLRGLGNIYFAML